MKMHPKQKTAFALASECLGMQEITGPASNADIVQMFADVGHAWVKEDSTAWCAAFVGAMLERAGLRSTGKLNARSYLNWGQPVDLEEAVPGDIVVFWRGSPDSWQGHVGFYHGRTGDKINVLGGNQSDEVNVSPYPVSRLLGVRRHAGASTPSRPPARPAEARPSRPAPPPMRRGGTLLSLFNRIFKR